MTDHPSAPGHPLRGLLVAGPRLGWAYRDPATAMMPFAEQPPTVPAQTATPSAPPPFPLRRVVLTGALGLGLAVAAGCCGLFAQGPSGTTQVGTQILVFAVVLALGTAGLIGYILMQHQARSSRAAAEATRPQREYQAAMAAWRQRAAAHQQAEAARTADMAIWQAAGPHPGASRLDIIGGTPGGWRDLLTVTGAGYLATHGPATVIDLTGDQLTADLHQLCTATGISVDRQNPPSDTDLLSGLDTAQLVDVLVESVHGDGDRQTRDRRATDTRILTAITDAISSEVSLARLADALRVLLKIPGPTPTLNATERAHIADELFPPDYLSASVATLQRLEAHLHPLRAMTSRPRPPATLTIVAADNDGTSARSEPLDDLILAWVTRRVATAPQTCRTLMIAAADPLPGRQVERLADICHRQHVALILLWRHLRDTAHTALGGGAVAFMRLRNAEEATRAADFIGRTHRFVLSGLTRTIGGSFTHTDTTGISDGSSHSKTDSASRSGRIAALIRQTQAWTRSEGATTGTTHTTSHQTSTAAGESWSDTNTTARVYEYAIEPTVLQGLPEHALLLVDHGQHGPAVQALDCNPAIVTLPGVAMTPAVSSTTGPVIAQPRHTPAITHTPPPAAIPSQAPPVHVHHPRAELWSDRGR